MVTFHTSFILGTNFLGFLDFGTGRTGGLFPRTPNEFFTGPGLLLTYPAEATVQFSARSNNAWSALTWQDQSGRVKGKRIYFREEEILFTNGSVRLAGSLIRPAGGQRHAAVLFVPASTAMATREMARPVAQYFAFHGVSCLIYDKRGTGASEGDWLRVGFGELADDALSAVRFLRARHEIEPKRVGLWGGSQGGWIVALAASRSPDVAFIMSQSGPGVTPEEQELYRNESFLRADGFSEEDIGKAMALVRQRYQWSRGGEGWETLSIADRAARKELWYPYIGALGNRENPFWRFWELIRDYDPLPALEKVRCPVLAVFGQRDTFVPVEKSALTWERSLKRAGNTDVTIKILPDADHSLIEVKSGGLKELPRLRRFVPNAFALQKDWLLKHVGVTP